MMRSTGNFSPEWGYLAPAPSILRTVRVVLVATAIGATAGAGVVLSLVDHSVGDGDKVAAAARAIVVTSVQAAPVQAPTMSEAKIAPAVAPVAQTPAQKPVQAAALGQTSPQAQAVPQAQAMPQIQTAPQVQAAAPDNAAPAIAPSAQDAATASATPASITNDAGAAAAPQQPAVAALSDPTVAAPIASTDATGDQGIVGPQQTAQQKKAKHRNSGFSREFPPVIGPALRHLFSARAGTMYYPNRAY
jgi:hypothetical protein